MSAFFHTQNESTQNPSKFVLFTNADKSEGTHTIKVESLNRDVTFTVKNTSSDKVKLESCEVTFSEELDDDTVMAFLVELTLLEATTSNSQYSIVKVAVLNNLGAKAAPNDKAGQKREITEMQSRVTQALEKNERYLALIATPRDNDGEEQSDESDESSDDEHTGRNPFDTSKGPGQ